MLGGGLLGQNHYGDAEPLLLAGYEGIKKRVKIIPKQGKIRLREAVERLVQLYEATGKTDEAAKWRKELDAINAGLKKLSFLGFTGTGITDAGLVARASVTTSGIKPVRRWWFTRR